MLIADEIEKMLVCENCFEKFNETNRMPITIFPCGHSYCLNCINNTLSKKCPECKSEFELTAKNWSLLNLLPKQKIADNFQEVRELVSLAIDLTKKFENINEEKNHECTGLIENIRNEVNSKADELVNKIKLSQSRICEQLDTFETRWKSNYGEYSIFQKSLNATFNGFDEQLNMENVKTSETNLNTIKQETEKNLNELNTFKLKCTNQSDEQQILYLKKSNLFNINVNEMFNEANLFGELVFNNKASINSNYKNTYFNSSKNNKKPSWLKNEVIQTANKLPIMEKNYEFETYSEIETIETTSFDQYLGHINHNDRELSKQNGPIAKNDPKVDLVILKVDNLNEIKHDNQDKSEFKLVNKQYTDLSNKALAEALPRKLTVHRTSKNEFYGFDLKTLKDKNIHLIMNIQSKSPAEKAGLKEGEYLLEVNDENVYGIDRDLTINKMLKNPTHVDLLIVTNLKAYLESKVKIKNSERRLRATTLTPNYSQGILMETMTNSRICYLTAKGDSKSFGYSITQNLKGPHRIHYVAKNSPASEAGLKVDDLILRLNGYDMIGKSYEKTIELLRKAAETGNYQLEVIEAKFCPIGLRNRSISFTSLNTKDLNSLSDGSVDDFSKSLQENSNEDASESNFKNIDVNHTKFNKNIEKTKTNKHQSSLFGLIRKKKKN